MKKLFAVLIVFLLLIIGVGFYRGWFALSKSDPDPGKNKINVNLTVDGDKIQEDAEAVKKKAVELTEKVSSGEQDANESTPDQVKSVEP